MFKTNSVSPEAHQSRNYGKENMASSRKRRNEEISLEEAVDDILHFVYEGDADEDANEEDNDLETLVRPISDDESDSEDEGRCILL